VLDYDFMKSYLQDLAAVIIQQKDNLNRLDAECGDGDFGVGMYIGFQSAQQAILESKRDDIGVLLNEVGRAILSSVGGASGPLYGTLFIESGKVVTGKREIDLKDLSRMFRNALERIRQRGAASVGDKTLVDALEPAVASLREAAENRVDMLQAIEMAVETARIGCESTKSLMARHGKARYLGEQTLGHMDPGAYVVTLIFQTLLSHCRSHSVSS